MSTLFPNILTSRFPRARFSSLFLLFHALKDNDMVSIVPVGLLNYFVNPLGHFKYFFHKLLTNLYFSDLSVSNLSYFSQLKLVVWFISTSCNSPLIWLSFAFFVIMHTSSFFFSIFFFKSLRYQNTTFRFQGILKNISIWSFLDSSKLEVSSCFLVSCPWLK